MRKATIMSHHIAILNKKYLDLILTRQKTIECRLTRIACAPFSRISVGEQVFLKQSSGPVKGKASVKEVRFYRDLTPEKIENIHLEYNNEILGDDDYWQSRMDCRYCTLIWLRNIVKLDPFPVKNRTRQGWIIKPDSTKLI